FGGQFLDRFLSDIGSFNLGVAGQGNDIGNNVGAVELAANGQTGLGKDHNGDGKGDGFNIPSLLAISYLPPYYHNGACETLACVLSNTTHRQAGLRDGQSDPLAAAGDQAKLIAFLESLDADTDFPLNLYVDPHDIFTDPPKPFKGSQAVVGANISLFGTKADLEGLMTDLGVSSLDVRITADPGLAPIVLQLKPEDFNQDFGQAVISTTWNIPADASGSRAQISVFVDAGDDLLETKESDNLATRTVQIRAPKPDTKRPVISNVAISDDDPFNAADVTTASQDVRIQFKASDEGDGLDAFCVVSYTYDVVRRRWVAQSCQFASLPAPESGTTDTFVVDATLQPKRGVAYAFVWVRDKAGNISRRPGFDVITFLTNDPINLNRNDVLILRLPLPSGNLQLDVDVEFGDVDVSVFDDFTNANATRCALSANNGSAPEQIVLPGSCPATPGRFQVEIRAVVSSRFTVSINQSVTAVAMAAAAQNATAQATLLAEPATPLVGGPPALLAAIDDDADAAPTIYLPLVQR
ncbi:MAG: hypothetical protein KDE31_19935, partial [Caldilineaceae bacterium]|nr:hypothetical protein [Caldilineaceae bacterium]